MSVPTFSPTAAKAAAKAIRSVDHKLRQQIIAFIESKGDEGSNVTDIYIALKIEQSVASQHLKIMRAQGVLFTKRNGKFITYKVDKERAEEINTAIKTLTKIS